MMDNTTSPFALRWSYVLPHALNGRHEQRIYFGTFFVYERPDLQQVAMVSIRLVLWSLWLAILWSCGEL